MKTQLKVLVIGCGTMGTSHALAYRDIPEFDIVGLVSRGASSRETLNRELGGGLPTFSDYHKAIETTQPDVVSINTYPDTHEQIALKAFEAGAHVFLEKPIAPTVEGCQRVIQAARTTGRKLVVGYILRHHPSWIRFIEIAQGLGKPLVMRMNLNQQSSGDSWETHKNLMLTTSPIVDCGVHYVDVMCQMTGAQPIRVSAIGARLTDELVPGMYNYGQLQVVFEDGSVGWYEAGWGPMISETAFFVKDVVGPQGCVSIVAGKMEKSADIDAHTQTESLLVHHNETDNDGHFVRPDEMIDLADEPDHNELCKREQFYLLKAIEEDLDLTTHWQDAINSTRIVLAADLSIRTGKTIEMAKMDAE
ncbi:Gfo/Idh/MocA family protein [Chloroflexota bacterium]